MLIVSATEGFESNRSFNYEDLLADLQKMSPEQRRQPVQIMFGSSILDDKDDTKGLMPVLCCGTIEHFGEDKTRGAEDNRHRPESVVLLADLNSFAVPNVFKRRSR